MKQPMWQTQAMRIQTQTRPTTAAAAPVTWSLACELRQLGHEARGTCGVSIPAGESGAAKFEPSDCATAQPGYPSPRRVGITSICLLCKLYLCAGHACDLRRPTSDAVPVPLTSHPILTMAAYADTSTSLLRSLARQLAGMRGSGHPSHAALLDVRAAHPRSQLHVRTVGDKITVWGDEGDESASGLAGGEPTAESQTASDVDLQELKSSIAAIVREYLQSGYVRATQTAWFVA